MAQTNYTYSKENDFPFEELSFPRFSATVLAALPSFIRVDIGGDVVDVWFSDALSQADQDVLTEIVENHEDDEHYLPAVKQAKFLAIDLRTDEMVLAGFQYPPNSGVRYSLELTSQIKILGLDALRADPVLVYPVLYNSLDDIQFATLANADQIRLFTLCACGTLRAILDSGTALKDAVRNAQDIAGVNAVVDSR